jgi:hypothetical protein
MTVSATVDCDFEPCHVDVTCHSAARGKTTCRLTGQPGSDNDCPWKRFTVTVTVIGCTEMSGTTVMVMVTVTVTRDHGCEPARCRNLQTAGRL